jgi:hypothetical protein
MSNSLAIAAVTATLRNLIEPGLREDVPGAVVTIRPPDKARNGNASINQINLFLYHTQPNAALRNMDMLGLKPGETGQPPLALNLYYLLTAYGQNDDSAEPLSHRLLGRAMSILHDHPLLGSEEIQTALSGNDLYRQVELVRITLQPLSLEELSKLWTTFQTQYRLSVAYQVAVILIESLRAARTPLPVLTRGRDDRGILSLTDLVSPFPEIKSVVPPNSQPSVRLGEILTIKGNRLDGAALVFFSHPLLPSPIELPPLPDGDSEQITVQLPDPAVDPTASVRWLCGSYTVSILIRRSGEPDSTTSGVAFTLAPKLTSTLPLTASRIGGMASVSVNCVPQILPDQNVQLLLGDRPVTREARTSPTSTLIFVVDPVETGEYRIRLRVDGVDSLLANRSVIPPVFDETQKVIIS